MPSDSVQVKACAFSSSSLPGVVLIALVELKTRRTLYVLPLVQSISLQNIAFSSMLRCKCWGPYPIMICGYMKLHETCFIELAQPQAYLDTSRVCAWFGRKETNTAAACVCLS